jgi:hypothetical protein
MIPARQRIGKIGTRTVSDWMPGTIERMERVVGVVRRCGPVPLRATASPNEIGPESNSPAGGDGPLTLAALRSERAIEWPRLSASSTESWDVGEISPDMSRTANRPRPTACISDLSVASVGKDRATLKRHTKHEPSRARAPTRLPTAAHRRTSTTHSSSRHPPEPFEPPRRPAPATSARSSPSSTPPALPGFPSRRLDGSPLSAPTSTATHSVCLPPHPLPPPRLRPFQPLTWAGPPRFTWHVEEGVRREAADPWEFTAQVLSFLEAPDRAR